MKIIEVNELKNKNNAAPFYSIIDPFKLGTADPRACGCATLALLNMILSLKKRMKIDHGRTAFDEMKWIQEQTSESENSTSPEVLMGFIDKHPIFNSCRMLVMNPNSMDEEVFLRILLRRLADGNLALVMMEVPDQADEPAKDSINHISFVHAKNGEVFFDGLPVDLNFLLRAFYFSRPTTLMFFAVNPGGHDGR